MTDCHWRSDRFSKPPTHVQQDRVVTGCRVTIGFLTCRSEIFQENSISFVHAYWRGTRTIDSCGGPTSPKLVQESLSDFSTGPTQSFVALWNGLYTNLRHWVHKKRLWRRPGPGASFQTVLYFTALALTVMSHFSPADKSMQRERVMQDSIHKKALLLTPQ